MAITGGEGDKANVSGKDLAAALAPERGRAPVLNKEVAALKERYVKDQGKSVFEADLAQTPEDLMVNFDEMRRVLDSEEKQVKAEKDPKKRDVLEKRYNRLELRYNIYDKLLNNEGFAAMDGTEKQELINTMSALPGFAEAASVAIGGRLSTDQMMKVLSGKGGVALTRDEKKAVSEIIVSMANDDRFKNRVSKSLSTLELDKDDHTLETNIENLRNQRLKDEQDAITIENIKKIREDYENPKTEDQIESIRTRFETVQALLNTLPLEKRPLLDSQAIKDKITAITAERDAIKPGTYSTGSGSSAVTNTGQLTAEQTNQIIKLNGYKDALETIKTAVGANGQELTDYKKYASAVGQIEIYESKSAERNARKTEFTQAESKRSKSLDKYKRKLEVTLSEEMKRYWNEVSLANASRAAEAQAAIKGEEEQAIKDMAEKRVAVSSEILERFTHLSFLKYEGGESKGRDDEALKKFVKQDILSRSPKQLARDILDRIIRNRGQMPRSYGKEIDALLKKMGVGEGTPPATARDILNSIPPEEYQKWAEERVPDVMGYARGGGYYFDKLALKPGQAEFLRRAYPPEFFEKAAAAKEKYVGQAAQLMGGEFKDFISDGALNWKKIRETLAGKDWKEGMKKLMKFTAYAGVGYVLGGGLMWQGGQYIGAERVLNTATNIGRLGMATAGAVSRAGEWAINAPTVAAANLLQYPAVTTNTVDATDAITNTQTTPEKFFPKVRTPVTPELIAP